MSNRRHQHKEAGKWLEPGRPVQVLSTVLSYATNDGERSINLDFQNQGLLEDL